MWLSSPRCPCPIKLGTRATHPAAVEIVEIYTSLNLLKWYTQTIWVQLGSRLNRCSHCPCPTKVGRSTASPEQPANDSLLRTLRHWNLLLNPDGPGLFFHDLNVASLCQTLIQGWGVYLFSPCLFPPLLRPLGNWGWGGFREARPCWPIWPQASLFICGPGRGQSTSFYCSLDLPTTHSWRHIVLIQSLKRNQPSFRYFAICQEPPQRPVIFPVE